MALLKKQKASPIQASKKGQLSKKALTFLQICKENFGFEPAKEFINLYSKEQELYQELYLRYNDDGDRKKMTGLEVDMFFQLHKEIKDSLKTFFKYSYPTMRAMQVKGDVGSRPIFNINLGVPTKEPIEVVNINSDESCS